MGGKSKSGRYIESFEVEFKVHKKIRELAKKDRITVSTFIRRAIEKQMVPEVQDEIYFPFADRFEQTVYEPLSNVLSSMMSSINKIADSNPALMKAFIENIKRLSRRTKILKNRG